MGEDITQFSLGFASTLYFSSLMFRGYVISVEK